MQSSLKIKFITRPLVLLFLVTFGLSNSGIMLSNSYANKQIIDKKIAYRKLCKTDLSFIQKSLKQNSAPYKNKKDVEFSLWYKDGYKNTVSLIRTIEDQDDCYYALKYYINGFKKAHISLRSYINLPIENYPGFLVKKVESGKTGVDFLVFYKNKNLEYLKALQLGARVTHINNIPIKTYFREYILPFYTNDDSQIASLSASPYLFIVDGNRYKPTPKIMTYINKEGIETDVELKYTELKDNALTYAKAIRNPNPNDKFKVEMVSEGVWIKIPSFYLSREEMVYYTGMISNLKKFGKEEDYILFDLRGNRGGAAGLARPIIRNLWGDNYIKSIKKHPYNKEWLRQVRVSKLNYSDAKLRLNEKQQKSFKKSLEKKDHYWKEKWRVLGENYNLYTHKDSSEIKSKIYVLTDHFCRSTCWNFVRDLKKIPSVTHIGFDTSLSTQYSYATRLRTPSENFDFFYPTRFWVYPDNKKNKAHIPDKKYDGKERSESELLEWILSITEKSD
jgi:uncharacterized lipoprotein YehR (DUF1307 family)